MSGDGILLLRLKWAVRSKFRSDLYFVSFHSRRKRTRMNTYVGIYNFHEEFANRLSKLASAYRRTEEQILALPKLRVFFC